MIIATAVFSCWNPSTLFSFPGNGKHDKLRLLPANSGHLGGFPWHGDHTTHGRRPCQLPYLEGIATNHYFFVLILLLLFQTFLFLIVFCVISCCSSVFCFTVLPSCAEFCNLLFSGTFLRHRVFLFLPLQDLTNGISPPLGRGLHVVGDPLGQSLQPRVHLPPHHLSHPEHLLPRQPRR